MAKTRPVHEFDLGNIHTAIWDNTNGEGRRYFRATFERKYRKDEKWLKSSSYSAEDLALLAQSASMACTWMCEHRELLVEDQAVSV